MSTGELVGKSARDRMAAVERPAGGARTRQASLVPGTRWSSRTKFGAVGAVFAMLLGMSAASADEPMPAPRCAVRLSVAVTPDVPDPSNGGFLSSLLGDHAEYQLFLLSRDDDTHVTLQLQGPGPAERCHAVVDSMRNDGRVQSIQVN
jgi:hypothetical protein